MKRLIAILLLTLVAAKSTAQITFIPDNRFEQALIDLGIDSDQIINGQILTSDALLVTELNLSPTSLPEYPYPANDIYEGMIHNLSGIESFINVENLTINVTMVENLPLGNLTKLRHLDCVDNMLTSIDISNNPLLEYLDISSGGDVLPANNFSEIDLSNNPNIYTLKASGIEKINLNNNNNNTQNMLVNVSCNYCWDYPPDFIVGSVCIEVDNVELAQSNQLPYSEWTVLHSNITVGYSDDLNQCSISTSKFNKSKVTIYPNPTRSGIVHIKSDYEAYKIEIFDPLGRKVFEKDQVNDIIDISNLKEGNYFMRVISDEEVQTEKLVVE